jgi:putative phosphoribosyl transferase
LGQSGSAQGNWPGAAATPAPGAAATPAPGGPEPLRTPEEVFALQVPFPDRAAAGRMLAAALGTKKGLERPVVVALARGGVPVGAEVARELGAPLYALPVAKVGAPGQEELAVGAVAPGGVTVLNSDVVSLVGLGSPELQALVERAASKAASEWRCYYGTSIDEGHRLPLFAGRAAIVVDDGLATGATMRAALVATRRRGPARLLMAVPVAPPEALASLASLVDDYVCLVEPRHMRAVGAWYEDFTQTTDDEVKQLLEELGPGGSSG